MTNTIIELIGYNEIPYFKYLNQAFLCSVFLFYKFYLINFHFGCGGGGVFLLKPKNENVILPMD